MDYEKKYKEALERARQIKDGKDEWRYSDLAEIIPALTYIFPQLRESEDERMIKAILSAIRGGLDTEKFLEKHGTNYEEVEAYLEKKKEIPMPNSTELIEMWDDEEKMLREKGIDDMWRLAYNAFLDGFAQGMMVKQKEQKKDNPLEDFSKGYNAGYYHGRTDSEQKPELVPHPITYMYPSDASRDEKLKMALLALLNSDLVKVAGNKFTKQDLIDWVEQKPAWSEDDEDKMGVIIRLVEQNSGWPDRAIKEYVNWLKSLRPSWKPSEEHLSALLAVFNDPDNIGSQTCQLALADLYEQLKKL